MNIEELISRVFAARNLAHIAHWGTSSYAQHEALGEFYDKVIDQLDTLVEAYMGFFGKIEKVDLDYGVKTDFATFLADEAKLICECRSQIARNNPALENLVDGLCEVYFKTFYKLANLK